MAILLGYTEGVRALIDGGAWIDVVDDCGRRPLLFACYAPSSSRGDYAIPTNGGEHDFMDKKAPENAIFSLLVESGAKIDSGVRDLSTTLHWAAFRSSLFFIHLYFIPYSYSRFLKRSSLPYTFFLLFCNVVSVAIQVILLYFTIISSFLY